MRLRTPRMPRTAKQAAKWAACFSLFLIIGLVWQYGASLYGRQARLPLFVVSLPLSYLLMHGLTRYMERGRAREAALTRRLEAEVKAESESGKQLCMAAIEALAYAVEGRTTPNLGHLARVQSYAVATARALGMEGDALDGVRVAALVHDIGRLGVPDNILVKEGALTQEEREKVRAYPVLGGRLLATIPFPWPIASIVRHHREHVDGSGYPDGLSGDAIPPEARILAVVDTYDALVSGGAHRSAVSHEEAIAQIQNLAGTQFDEKVVAAFASVMDSMRAQAPEEADNADAMTETMGATGAIGKAALSAAYDIARAQREVQGLYELACSVGSTLCLDETMERVAQKIAGIVSSTSCAFFLCEEDEEWLYACATFGANQPFFYHSRARLGTYLTGRVASRGTSTLASYLPDDVVLRQCAPGTAEWTPLRSTLIVPLVVEGQVIGTINLYHAEPDAFHQDDLRVMQFVGEVAGRAIHNARLFSQSQESAYTDAVTGLRNRRYMRHFLDQELNRARKNGHALAVLGLDLDRFKPVNDTYGHERGDQVLREVAMILQAQIRNYDLVARYAGDEFAIILPETTREEAEIVAKKVMEAVDLYAEGLVRRDPDFPRVGISVGIALFPEQGEDVASLLAYADQVMYDNKRTRRAAREAA